MFNPAEHFIQLKGKDYLQVMWRIVWFREEHPDYAIETELVSHDQATGSAVFHAVIKDDKGYTLSTGHGSETRKDFGDYLEKAETKAIGRALAYLGYGTQFAPELDEEERIVDSPVDRKKPQKAAEGHFKPVDVITHRNTPATCERCKKAVTDALGKDGGTVPATDVISTSRKRFNGACYCASCQKEIMTAAKAAKEVGK